MAGRVHISCTCPQCGAESVITHDMLMTMMQSMAKAVADHTRETGDLSELLSQLSATDDVLVRHRKRPDRAALFQAVAWYFLTGVSVFNAGLAFVTNTATPATLVVCNMTLALVAYLVASAMVPLRRGWHR